MVRPIRRDIEMGPPGHGGPRRRPVTRDSVDRRDFLRHAALLGTGAALYPWSRSLTGLSGLTVSHHDLAVPPTHADLSQIEHVVILIQENRSYDHYFGTYPKGRGFDDHPNGDLGVFSQVDPRRPTGSPPGRLLPFHLNAAGGSGACTYDVAHEWPTQHASWNGGRMDQWAVAHTAIDGRIRGPLMMGYYTRRDLPLYYALADTFTLCDHYFCSALAASDPNRHYSMSGTIDPAGRAGGPVVTNAPSVAAPAGSHVATNAARYSWTTMPERLQAQGVSWRVYQAPGSLQDTTTNNILIRFEQYADPSTPLYRNAFLPTYPHDFVADVAAGTLPSVSWLNAPPNQDEHPPSPPNTGARVTGHVLQTLLSNPKVWAKTVFFVTWDENGGFFDHVVPPGPPPGTPDEFVTTDPLPPAAAGISGPIGLGFRVPMLVMSPFSRGGHINSDTFDHTSLLRFLETRFGVEVPNLSEWRRNAVSDLTSTLQLSRPPRLEVPTLPYSGLSTALVNRECADISAVPPPTTQHMPTQAR